MTYESFFAERVFTEITTEAEARSLLWHSRFQGKEFIHSPCCHARVNRIKRSLARHRADLLQYGFGQWEMLPQ